LYRDFGNADRYVSNPYFVLYNKYQGLLRTFVLTQAEENFTSASMQFYFNEEGENKTALLTHASNRAYAVDEYKEDNVFLSSSSMVNHEWMYVDYATAYDPNTSLLNNSIITFDLFGVILTDLKINGTLNLIQELPKSSTSSTNLSESDQLVANGKRAIGYYNTFNGYKEQLDKANKKQKDGPLRTALDQLYAGWLPDALPYIGAAVGIVDFFVGGGRSQKKESPVPMVFNGDMELTGTLETKKRITTFSMQTPGTQHSNGSNFVPLYDKPLGIFNLTTTPVLESKHYWEPAGNGSSMDYRSYRLKNDLSYSVNPHADLELHSLDAALVFRLWPDWYAYPYDLLPGIKDWIDQGIYEIESSLDDNHYVLRTKYIPHENFKNTVITVPPYTDVTIKIKAVLKRKNAPSGTQDVLFVADYEPDFEQVGGAVRFPWNTNQTAPSKPRNLTTKGSVGNHPLIEWDLGTGIEKYEIWKKDYLDWRKYAEVGPSVRQYEDASEDVISNGQHQANQHYVYYKVKAVDYAGNKSDFSNSSSIKVEGLPLFKQSDLNQTFSFNQNYFNLSSNYPNPFNPETIISFSVPERSNISLKVYDVSGKEIAVLEKGVFASGFYNSSFNGKSLSSGVYLYRLEAKGLESGETFSDIKRMILIK